MVTFIKNLVDELNLKLGDRTFYTLHDLTSIGFFGSIPSARRALLDGCIPFFRVTPRRILISRQSLLKFLEDHYISKEKKEKGSEE